MKLNIFKFLNDLNSKYKYRVDNYFKNKEYNLNTLILFSLAYCKYEYVLSYILSNYVDLNLYNLKYLVNKILLIGKYDNVRILLKNGYDIKNIDKDFLLEKCVKNYYSSEKLMKYLYFFEIYSYNELHSYFINNPYFYSSKSKDKLCSSIQGYLNRMKNWSKWTKYKDIMLIKKNYENFLSDIKNKPKKVSISSIDVLTDINLIRNIAKFI